MAEGKISGPPQENGTCCGQQDQQKPGLSRRDFLKRSNAGAVAIGVVTGTGSDMYSAITGGIGALRGPKHGGANEVAFEIQKRYDSPAEAEADIRRRVEDYVPILASATDVVDIGCGRGELLKLLAEQVVGYYDPLLAQFDRATSDGFLVRATLAAQMRVRPQNQLLALHARGHRAHSPSFARKQTSRTRRRQPRDQPHTENHR